MLLQHLLLAAVLLTELTGSSHSHTALVGSHSHPDEDHYSVIDALEVSGKGSETQTGQNQSWKVSLRDKVELIRSEGGSDPGISVPNPHLTGAAGVDASPLVTQGSQFSLEDMEERKKKKKDEIVTVVVTAGQLLRALQRGDAHVEIQAHLNVTGKYFGMFRNHYHVVGPLPRSVLSIQGNCEGEPPEDLTAFVTGAPLLPRLPRQCLIVTDAPFLSLRQGPLWFDNLYMRRVQKADDSVSDRRSALVHVREDRWFAWQQRAKLWMTNITMQGDGQRNDDCDVCGMRSSEAMVYAEGCTFADFVGTQTVLIGELFGELTSYDSQSSSAFTNCVFLRNEIHVNKYSRHFNENPAIIEAKEWTGDESYACNSVFIRLEQCSFQGFNECHDAEFYSDITRTVFQPGDTHHVLDPTKPLSDVPGVARFLNISDPWITQIKEALPMLPRRSFSRKDRGPKPDINMWWTLLHYVQVIGMWIVFIYGVAAVFFVFSIMAVELSLIGFMGISKCVSWVWRSLFPPSSDTRTASIPCSSGSLHGNSGRIGSGLLPNTPVNRPQGYGPLAPLIDTSARLDSTPVDNATPVDTTAPEDTKAPVNTDGTMRASTEASTSSATAAAAFVEPEKKPETEPRTPQKAEPETASSAPDGNPEKNLQPKL